MSEAVETVEDPNADLAVWINNCLQEAKKHSAQWR